MAESLAALTGNIEERELEKEMRSSYLDYAMSVIVGRALPDVRDGLKPVHRRVLYAMHDLGLQPNRPYRKSAFIVGEVMGKYHPHGDSAIYDTLVRMAQDFSLRYPLIDGQGNFGSIDDDPAAAMRYCVIGETRVATPDGMVRIDAIVPDAEPESDSDVAIEVLGRFGSSVRASKLFHSGSHPVIRICTENGAELTGSRNHPVLCRLVLAGEPILLWRMLSELRPNDEVALAPAPQSLVTDRPYGSQRRQAAAATAATTLAEPTEARALVAPDANYRYARVRSVEEAGVEPVYSLRVDSDDHSFITNGLISHNTEARLDRLATEMLRDIEAETVDFGPNYDERNQEPLLLPARFPNLLVNGSSGIAVGMATNIPPHNLREVSDAVIAYIENPEIDLDGLMHHIKGPDFPGGGLILRSDGIRDAYATGRGSVKVQARAHIEPLKGGRDAIIVSELPFMVKKGGDGGLIQKIADLVREKKLTGISDLRDESDRSGMRLVIEVKRGEQSKAVLNQLFKRTQMQTSFGVNMVALVDNVPKTLSLRELIAEYVLHQREVVTRRTQYELRKAEAEAHILEGLLVALDNLDAVITLIRGSKDPDEARAGLMKKFELSEKQAQAILDMRLQRLTALQANKVREDHQALVKLIAELREILGDESRIDGLIKDELTEVVKRYGDDRRSELSFAEGDIDIEDMIADQQMVISITHSGYVKRLPLTTYRQQRRGGVGVTGMNLKEGDYIEHLHVCSTHDWMLFFTNRGKVYRLKVYELPEGARTSKGKSLNNVLPLRDGEKVMAVIPTRDFTEGKFLAFATAQGLVKKTEFTSYNTPIRADGIIAIKVRDGDELVQVRLTSGKDDLLLISKSGHAARFSEAKVRSMGRDTSGVKGMNVAGKIGTERNRVLTMAVAHDDTELFMVTENGYGKRTKVSEYPSKGRGTKGVLTARLTEKKGGLAGALIVREHEDLVFISQNGMVQRTSVGGISLMGRATQGVRVMNIKDDDLVSAVALVVESSTADVPDSPQAELEELESAGKPDASSNGAGS